MSSGRVTVVLAAVLIGVIAFAYFLPGGGSPKKEEPARVEFMPYPKDTTMKGFESESHGVITEIDSQSLLMPGNTRFYLPRDQREGARAFLGKEAIVEIAVLYVGDLPTPGWYWTVTGVFDPKTFIGNPRVQYQWNVVGRMRLFKCRLTEVNDTTTTVVTPKGRSYTFEVPGGMRPRVQEAKGKEVSVAAVYYGFHDDPVLVAIRLLE